MRKHVLEHHSGHLWISYAEVKMSHRTLSNGIKGLAKEKNSNNLLGAVLKVWKIRAYANSCK